MTTLKVWALTQTCSTPGTHPPPVKGTSRIYLLIRPELLSLAQDPPAAEHEPGTGSVQHCSNPVYDCPCSTISECFTCSLQAISPGICRSWSCDLAPKFEEMLKMSEPCYSNNQQVSLQETGILLPLRKLCIHQKSILTGRDFFFFF